MAELERIDGDWERLDDEARRLAQSLQKVDRIEEMALGVVGLERRQREARDRLESLIAPINHPQEDHVESVDIDPKGPEYRPHNTTTNESSNSKNTVIASEESESGASGSATKSEPAATHDGWRSAGTVKPPRTDYGTVMRMHTDELVRLAPRLRPYLRTSTPTWSDIVEAAYWVRHDLGVSKPLWGEACLTMGREEAAIAIAIVSSKPAEHFRTNPARYFFGMVAKAKAGELNLGRTVWGLRSGGKEAAPRH